MHCFALSLFVWISCAAVLETLDLDKLPPRADYKNCTKDADCSEGECCTFEAEATLSTSTKIMWRCKPLGDLDQICHSLGSVHCPCKAGLRCAPKAVWFFGAGLCQKKNRW